MAKDESRKVTFYADPDVKRSLDQLDPGTKSHTINSFLRKGFEGGKTMPERLDVLDAKIRTLLEEALRRTLMYDKEIHGFCSEFYSIEKTLELVVSRRGQQTTVRLEALRDEENGRYSIRAYMQEHVTLQPSYPKADGKFKRKPEDFVMWVDFPDFPWVNRETADGALRQALGFLQERCDSPIRS